MTLANREEFENTRKKVDGLQQMFDRARERPETNPQVRELTLRSLGNRIKRMREEMIRFEIEEAKRVREGGSRALTLEGVVRNGVVEFVDGANLPEGSHVTVCVKVLEHLPESDDEDAMHAPGSRADGMPMTRNMSEHLPDDFPAGTR